MKIKSVQAIAIDVGFQNQKLQTNRIASPMSRWPAYAEQRSSWMWPTKKTFVRIQDVEGNVGWSCTNGGEVTALVVQQQLSRLITGETTDDLTDLWDRMYYALVVNDRSGFAMMAISGMDIALWDLKAKQKSQPLLELLGGAKREVLQTYATVSSPLNHRGRSWWGLKAAMPYAPSDGKEGLEGNLDHMRQFRDVARENGRIMLDAFMAWDSNYTIRFAEAARDLDIYWIEDPLPPHDLEGLAKIRKAAGDNIRLALGNFCFNRWDCKALLDEELVDILQPDVAWAGGITECIRILDLAASYKVPVILHNTCEQPWALALAAAKQKNPVVEFVDRGETSALYGLVGQVPRWSQEDVVVSDQTAGNQLPANIRKHFERGGD